MDCELLPSKHILQESYKSDKIFVRSRARSVCKMNARYILQSRYYMNQAKILLVRYILCKILHKICWVPNFDFMFRGFIFPDPVVIDFIEFHYTK